MRIQGFIAALLLLATPAQADPEQVAAQLRDQALKGTIAYDLVESLTTEVGHRLVGSPGDAKAVAWAEAKLKALGFDKVWSEPFEMEAWVRGSERAQVTAPFPQTLQITTLGGSVATPKAGIEAELALFRTFDDLLAAPVGSLAGKIAIVTQRTLKAQDGSGYGATWRNRGSGAVEAARRGALAYLVRSLGTHTHRFAHTGSMTYAEGVPKIPAAAVSPPDVELIERIARRGQPVRLKLDIQPRLAGKVTTHNVIAELTGREKPQEIIAIGAHLDSWDLGTGALDDGAGIGIVTAAAKLIADRPERPRRTIRVIYFGAEEVGLTGARAYVAARTPEAMNQHLLGSESDFGAGPIYRLSVRVNPDQLPAFAPIMRVLSGMGIAPGNNTASGGPDMGPLRATGMPVFTLEQDGRDYFDFHHTSDDTLDRINPHHLDQNVAAWAAMTYWAAEADGIETLRPITGRNAARRPSGNFPAEAQ